MSDLQILRIYAQDVLGIRSFILSSDVSIETESKVELVPAANFVLQGSSTPRVLFLRQQTEVSVLSGSLSELYKKILSSLKRPDQDIATIEWTKTSEVLESILTLNPQIVMTLGAGAANFVELNATQLKSFQVIKSCDPELISNNDDLKRSLWNDLKTVMKKLELS